MASNFENNPLLECKVCYIQYDKVDRRPRSLPCGHTFCTSCIVNTLGSRKKLNCPTCRSPHSVRTGAASLPVNFDLEELLAGYIALTAGTTTTNVTAPGATGTTTTASTTANTVKQCPMCYSAFPTLSQKEFEEHVSGHLAASAKQTKDKQCPVCTGSYTQLSQKRFEEHVQSHFNESGGPALASGSRLQHAADQSDDDSDSLANTLNTFEIVESPGAREVLEVDNAFNLSLNEIRNKEFYLKYSATKDIYIRAGRSGPGFCEIVGWEAGTHQVTNICRKHEPDHKMVYLARKEMCSRGSISWLVNWAGSGLVPYTLTIKLPHTTFHQGKVTWHIKLGSQVMSGYTDGIIDINEGQIRGSPTSLQVCAELFNDEFVQNSNVAWQWAQLFRQADTDVHQFPLLIHIKFCERTTVVEETHALNLSPEEVRRKEFLLKYSAAKDVYVRPIKRGEQETRGWLTGVYGVRDMFRKHEHDHKMVYLARKEGATVGWVQWRVNWSGIEITPQDVTVSLPHTTFYSGKVTWYIKCGEQTFPGCQGGTTRLRDLQLGAVGYLDVYARVEGGSTRTQWGSNVAWQHAQIFRQKETDIANFPFLIIIQFRDQ